MAQVTSFTGRVSGNVSYANGTFGQFRGSFDSLVQESYQEGEEHAREAFDEPTVNAINLVISPVVLSGVPTTNGVLVPNDRTISIDILLSYDDGSTDGFSVIYEFGEARVVGGVDVLSDLIGSNFYSVFQQMIINAVRIDGVTLA